MNKKKKNDGKVEIELDLEPKVIKWINELQFPGVKTFDEKVEALLRIYLKSIEDQEKRNKAARKK